MSITEFTNAIKALDLTSPASGTTKPPKKPRHRKPGGQKPKKGNNKIQTPDGVQRHPPQNLQIPQGSTQDQKAASTPASCKTLPKNRSKKQASKPGPKQGPKQSSKPHRRRDNSSSSDIELGSSKSPNTQASLHPIIPSPPPSNLPSTPPESHAPPTPQAVVYILQCRSYLDGELVLSVYHSLSAGERDLSLFLAAHDIPPDAIVSTTRPLASLRGTIGVRRTHVDGLIEIQVRHYDLDWVRISRWEVPDANEGGSPFPVLLSKVFLAVDVSGRMLFVIGAFASKSAAWEACKEYWAKLGYMDGVEGLERWVDRETGMYCAKGVVADTRHLWTVRELKIHEGRS